MMRTTRPGRIAKAFLSFGVMVVATFVAVEGLSSLVLSGLAVSKGSVGNYVSRPTERSWTQYDKLLGWTSVPNLAIPDLFGPGVFLHTNAQGFRGSGAVDTEVPAGKIRVICSGDSFTFGYGVDDNHAWCQLLASMDPRIEAVNMGQSSYGIDQAYLWYKRDGSVLQPDVLIFAFITDDFYRMETSEWFLPKPFLDLDDHGQLVVKNVPVPRRRSYLPKIPPAAGQAVRQLRSHQLEARVLRRLARGPSHAHTWQVAVKVFESLQKMCAKKGSAFVLVLLPTAGDILDWEEDSYWRPLAAAEASKRGWLYVDLIGELRQLPAERSATFFNRTQWHYTNAGNQWVADVLLSRIAALPQLRP